MGALRYPIEMAEPVCPQALGASLIDGLGVSIVDAERALSVSAAGTSELVVELTNIGETPIEFGSGNPTAVVTDAEAIPRTVDILGSSDVGINLALQPGESERFTIALSLASCDPADGYLVDSGGLFAVVSFYNAQLQATMNSEPLPIAVAS